MCPKGVRYVRYAAEVALWLLVWGEAANLRFCPEVRG
jgi:hypothetical protein